MKSTVVLLLNNLYAVIYIGRLCVGIINLLVVDSTLILSDLVAYHVMFTSKSGFDVPYSQFTNQQ